MIGIRPVTVGHPIARFDPARKPPPRGRLAEIARDRLGADSVLGDELGGQLLEPLLAAGDQHDVVPPRSELARDALADAGGRARNERG